MPRLDGFGFLDALRARDEWKTVPVIVISAKCTTDGDRSRLQSATAILQKGTHSTAELLRAVGAAGPPG
jgi:two-component system chemotaxis response regulator CheY